MICIENMFFGGRVENVSSPSVSQTTKFKILFLLDRLGTEQKVSLFFKFWKKKKNCFKFMIFSSNFIYFVLYFFYWKQMENKKKRENFAVYIIQFPRKWCLFQWSRSKTVGEDTFLAAKSKLYRRREKHIKTQEY